MSKEGEQSKLGCDKIKQYSSLFDCYSASFIGFKCELETAPTYNMSA